MTSSCRDLREAVFSIPIVDTHTHIRQYETIEQPFGAIQLFNGSGCLRQYWVAAGALTRLEFRQMRQFADLDSLAAANERVKTTAYYRILLEGLAAIYEIDLDELDAHSFDALDAAISRAYQDPDWYRVVLREKANMAVNCQDCRTPIDRALFTPVARLDYYVMFGRPGWSETIIAKHGQERASSLQGLLDCLRLDFEEAMASGAAAIKENDTWGRPLVYDEVTENEAAKALESCRSGARDEAAAKALGDFMMDRICDLCAEHNLPIQFHTGPAGGIDHFVQYGNPLNLTTLMLRHPETKFVLFHAGGPFVGECRALAVQFANVYLDLCGVLGRETIRVILDDWIEHVPHGKLMWGTDVALVEEAYAVAVNFRNVLARFLADRVEAGYFAPHTAQDFARAILADNARRLLRLAPVVGPDL